MNLTNENIGKTIQDVEDFFEHAHIAKRDIVKITLILEEALILYQGKFGENQEYEVRMKKYFGAPKVIIRIKAEPFNPLNENSDSIFTSDLMSKLLNYESAGTVYKYSGGVNEIETFSTKERKFPKIPGGKTSIALILAIISSCAINFLPDSLQYFIIHDLSKPLFHSLMGIIMAATYALIFTSVASGICVMDDVTTFSTLGLKIVKRFVILTVLLAIVSMVLCQMFFPVIEFNIGDNSAGGEIIALLLTIIPTNFIKPFLEGNILQIVVIATLLGICILMLGERVSTAKKIIHELKQIVFSMMNIVSKIIYLTIFLSIFNAIVANSLDEMLSTWSIVVANLLAMIIFCVLHLAYLAAGTGINVADFLRKISTVLTLALYTASGSITIPENFNVCKNKLHIDSKLCDIWIPLTHAMFVPSVITPLVVCAFYGAFSAGQTLSISQLLILLFLIIQLSMATPVIPGGVLASFTILLSQLNLPQESIGQLMIANIFIMNIQTCLAMLIRDAAFADFAHSQGKMP